MAIKVFVFQFLEQVNFYTLIYCSIGSNFKPLRGLDIEVVHQLLKYVAEKEMSMQELITECRDVKGM